MRLPNPKHLSENVQEKPLNGQQEMSLLERVNKIRKPEAAVVSVQDQMNFWNYLNDIQYGALNKDLLTKANTWLLTKDSTFLIQKNNTGFYAVKKSDAGIPTLPKIDYPDAFFELAYGQIPNSILEQIIGFFREIMKRHNDAEAFIQVYWDKQDNQYIVNIPKQRISKASVNYDATENLNLKDPARYVFAYECHSHNSMKAFWSGTDNADEKELRVYGVFGELDKDNYASKHRFFVGEEQIDCNIKAIFDMPKEEEKKYVVTHKNKQYFVSGNKLQLDETPKYILETEAGEKHYVSLDGVVLHRNEVTFPETWFANINVPLPAQTRERSNNISTVWDLDFPSYGKKDKKNGPKDFFNKDLVNPFYSRDFDTFDAEWDYTMELEQMSEEIDAILDRTNGFEDEASTQMFLESLEFKSSLKELELAIHNYHVTAREAEKGPSDGRY